MSEHAARAAAKVETAGIPFPLLGEQQIIDVVLGAVSHRVRLKQRRRSGARGKRLAVARGFAV
ncbi:MAG: hypothetical protein IPJ33_06655 [Gammaproteobacteria bacterium]|jgi:hypothetical protein|nr:hypothetical protein [Gammaproteobacteria bacterium]MBP6051050.1 hypothetical protein [Pseudomonadales bacterium]MBK6584154.1 hypothetical protein [Gammaproteobacteria bacterium]MBK7520338.1 hypothetical protein [Gammaproteobacteria bacterium]MBK7728173.1 hypothetical protein [Gammaproteobacteria bacterium]